MMPTINYERPGTILETEVVGTLQELKTMGYADLSRYYFYELIFRRLIQFALNHGKEKFSSELSELFLREWEAAGAKKTIDQHEHLRKARRAMKMLADFTLTGACQTARHKKTPPPPPKMLAGAMDAFLHYWENERHVSPKTLEYGRWALSQLLFFLDQKGIHSWSDLRPELFSAFFATRTNLGQRSLKLMATVLRVFLRWQFMSGVSGRDWSHHVPPFRGFRNQRIPAVWSDKELNTLLTAVDRNRPKGKRDYAILLLACRLGMRAGDIRDLRLENLNWDDARIEFEQNKSGRRALLPLTEEIGLALIDYLQNARPAGKFREIFLSVHPPCAPLARGNKLYGIIERYRTLAGVTLPQQAKGLHSLRHTIASRLLNAGNPLESIADILGHASMDTTRIYTRIDVEQLRGVALDPEVNHA
jgi:site-specific recombinase XerD